jgi:ABC-type multidrug transport system ATPase subunit
MLADRVGILDGGELLALESVADLKRRYAADSLEAAFFAATGRDFEQDETEEASWRVERRGPLSGPRIQIGGAAR